MDLIHHLSFKCLLGIVTFLSSVDIFSFNGENVPMATSHFKAMMQALPPSLVPAKTIDLYLEGMSKALGEMFQEVCYSLCGSINTPMYVDWHINALWS